MLFVFLFSLTIFPRQLITLSGTGYVQSFNLKLAGSVMFFFFTVHYCDRFSAEVMYFIYVTFKAYCH